MRLTILTGPGEVKKRDFLVKLRSKYAADSITVVNLKSETLEKLQNSLLSLSLFETTNRLIIVEAAPESLDLEKLDLPADESIDLVILFSGSAVTSTLLKSAQSIKSQNNNLQILNFELEGEINAFGFLDFLIEGKTEAHLELEKLYSEFGTQYILTMIYYLLRRNLLPAPKSDFMKRKVAKQKAHFSASDWQRLYRLTIDTDFAIKSGSVEEKVALTLLVEAFNRQPQAGGLARESNF